MKKKAIPKNAGVQHSNIMNAGREVSAMAWIENEFGHVLMVRQAQGNRQWTLPGGKVRPMEPVLTALKREVREETGLSPVDICLAAVYDRTLRNNLTVLFFATLKLGPFEAERPEEILEVAFKTRLPSKASPSAKYFWEHRRAIKNGPRW